MGVVIAVLASLAGGCGGGDHARPVLHRPAAAAWCPSTDVAPLDQKLGEPRHGAWDARAIIGLPLDAATREAERHDCVLRLVGGKDADPRAVLTMDLRFDRINIDATDGVVTGLDDESGDVVG